MSRTRDADTAHRPADDARRTHWLARCRTPPGEIGALAGPLMQSAQAYVDMWSKAWRVNGCDAAGSSESDYEACAGSAQLVAFSTEQEHKICRNTCPDDAGRGMNLRPDGTRYEYKPLP